MTNLEWVAVLSSGLAGAVLNQGWLEIKQSLNSPRIKAIFKESEPGCRAMGGSDTYFRLKIFNTGPSSAKNVRVLISSVQRSEAEVYDAIWSGAEQKEGMDIPSNTHRFCDIFVLKGDVLSIQSIVNEKTVVPYKFGKVGMVDVRIHVTSDNGPTYSKIIKLNYQLPSELTKIA